MCVCIVLCNFITFVDLCDHNHSQDIEWFCNLQSGFFELLRVPCRWFKDAVVKREIKGLEQIIKISGSAFICLMYWDCIYYLTKVKKPMASSNSFILQMKKAYARIPMYPSTYAMVSTQTVNNQNLCSYLMINIKHSKKLPPNLAAIKLIL